MAQKKIPTNFYIGNVKSDFLSPRIPNMKRVKTTSFGIGPVPRGRGPKVMPLAINPTQKIKSIQKINFFPAQKRPSAKNSLTKHINSSLVPKKSSKFVPSQQFLSPYHKKGEKGVSRKNMNWVQAKQRNPGLNPFGDADKDKVINIFDCHPYDPSRDGVLSSIGKAASSAAKAVSSTVTKAATSVAKAAAPVVSTVTKAVAPVAATVSKAYTSVDKAVGGVLPGGAPVTKTTTPVATSPKVYTAAPKSQTTIATVASSVKGGQSTPSSISTITSPTVKGVLPVPTVTVPASSANLLKDIKTSTTPTTITKASSSSSKTSGVGGIISGVGGVISGAYTSLDKSLGGILPGGVPQGAKLIPTSTPKSTSAPLELFKPAPTSAPTPKAVQAPTYDSSTGTYTDEYGNKFSRNTAPAGANLIGGGEQSYTGGLGEAEKKAKDLGIKYEKEEDKNKGEKEVRYRYSYNEPVSVTPSEITPQEIKGFFSGVQARTSRFRPSNVTAFADITPQQLKEMGIQTALSQKYPLVLNINPNERTKIPAYLLAMKPTIIYTTEMPTRLSIYSPTGTGTAKQYTQYNLRVSELPSD